MRVPVFVMAGGRGSRMRPSPAEKPLLKVHGIPLVERVRNALLRAGIRHPVIVTSPWTPRTEAWVRERGWSFVRSPGKGYVPDVQWLLEGCERFVTVAADLPFLRSEPLRALHGQAARTSGPLAGVLPEAEAFPWSRPSRDGRVRVPGLGPCRYVGINAVLASPPGEPARGFHVLHDPWLGVNVNTPSDWRRARAVARTFPEEGAFRRWD